MRIIFMGTPAFAIPSLKKLHESHHAVAAVVTVPDKPAGRGLKTRYSAVKEAALKYNLPVLQPSRLDDTEFVNRLDEFEAELFVVVAFRILPEIVFDRPPKGTINLHSSLLPKYRGAAPISWAIINGEKQTGVSTIYIQKSIDTGDLIFQDQTDISADETAGELHDRLADMGSDLLLNTVTAIEKGAAPRQRQKGLATRAPKLTRDLAQIDWRMPAEKIHNLVRGLNPVPGAFTKLNGKIIKFFSVTPTTMDDEDKPGKLKPGEVTLADRKAGSLWVATGDSLLSVTELQPEGKRRMGIKDFLIGYKIEKGEMFDIQ